MTTQNPSALPHPVWDVYDILRDVRLNVKYYAVRLQYFRRWNVVVEVLLGATVSGSAVGLWWVWDTSVGKPIWQTILGVSAVAAVAKPVLKLTDTIQEYQAALKGYEELDHRLQKLQIQIHQDATYSQNHRKIFEDIFDRMGELDQESPETRPHRKLVDKLTREVNQELPRDRFYVPS